MLAIPQHIIFPFLLARLLYGGRGEKKRVHIIKWDGDLLVIPRVH